MTKVVNDVGFILPVRVLVEIFADNGILHSRLLGFFLALISQKYWSLIRILYELALLTFLLRQSSTVDDPSYSLFGVQFRELNSSGKKFQAN